MKKIYTNKLLTAALSLFVLIVLMSNSSGRANVFGQGVTGAPGDTNRTCASSGCHSSGAFSPSASLSVVDDEGNSVTTFTPGETYDISLTVEASGNPSAYGFQMIALKDSDESSASDWRDIGDNTQTVQIGTRTYLEHDSPSSSNVFNTKWTAPEAGSGPVTFYFAANAVNGNGSTSGDGGTNSKFKLFELTTSSTDLEELNVSVFPNPTSDFLTISGENLDYNYTILDLQGQKVRSSAFSRNVSIDMANLESGLYFVTILNEGNFITKKIIKK